MEGSDLLRTFETELHNGSQQIQSLFLQIEQAGSFDDAASLLQEAYRMIHSIKGAGRVVGLSTVEHMAHAVEDRLQYVIKNRQKPSPEETSVFLRIAEAFLDAFNAFLTAQNFDPAPYVEELTAAISVPEAKAAAKAETAEEKTDESPEKEHVRIAAPRREEYVMVPTYRIDELFRRVEEAFLIESRLSALVSEVDTGFQEGDGTDPVTLWHKNHPHLQKEANRLHFVLMQFHELVRLFRMVPMGRLRVPLQRAIRDLAITLGKSVLLHFEGENQMVDGSLLESLQEPLLHVVRNATDHGIESPEERRNRGKPAEGHIAVGAMQIGGFLQLVISDDGRGIDAENIRKRALEQGITTQEESTSWTESDWFELLFRPGFSTAAAVSAISGRGMGMDIVRARIQALGGSMQLSSSPNAGTTIQIHVPIGLLTPRALLVRCGSRKVAVPTSDIERVFPFRPGKAETINGQMLVRLNQTPLSVEPLARHLGWESSPGIVGHIVAVCWQGSRKGLLVDEILGEIEQVAFPPPWNLRGIPYLSGVIVLGDGTLVPVVDTRDLVRGVREMTMETAAATSEEKRSRQPALLVVDDSPTILALHRSILKNAGYEVLTADDGQGAWNLLQSNSVNLVLTDIEMPRMNGFELIERIRQTPASKHLPIIVISQYGKREDLQRAASAGADRYIVKSAFDPQRLLEMVRELLE